MGGSERVRHWKDVSFLVVSGAPLWLFFGSACLLCPSFSAVGGCLCFGWVLGRSCVALLPVPVCGRCVLGL